jgi:uncharacterized protein
MATFSEQKPSTEAIDKVVRKIVELVHPLSIILFGSSARGEAKPESDIDLMVVMPEGVHRRKTAQFLYQHISGIKTPFDIVVATPRDLEKHKNNVGLIYKSVMREGKEVYAA